MLLTGHLQAHTQPDFLRKDGYWGCSKLFLDEAVVKVASVSSVGFEDWTDCHAFKWSQEIPFSEALIDSF